MAVGCEAVAVAVWLCGCMDVWMWLYGCGLCASRLCVCCWAMSCTLPLCCLVVPCRCVSITSTAPDGGLQGDFLIMIHVAKQGSAVLYGGLYAATLSSAIASMVGAPRVLMAFARDGIVNFLQPFAVSWGPNEEPLRAYAVTFIIALPLVIAADINFVSPFVTNFFLTSCVRARGIGGVALPP